MTNGHVDQPCGPSQPTPPAAMIPVAESRPKFLECTNGVSRIISAWLSQHGLAATTLLLLVACAFGSAVTYDFVNWDDPWYVINNPLIKSWSPGHVFEIATQPAIRNYAPLTILSFLVDHTLWGLWPGGYHLTNLIWHTINCILVYHLVSRLSRDAAIGWLAAALFAIHPVQVESVVWISSRKGLISGTFLIGSLLFWLQPDRTERQEGLGLLLFVLALLSKAIAVMVPPIVLAYDILVRRQTLSSAGPRQFVPGCLALLLVLITSAAQSTMTGGVRGHLDLSRLEILMVDSIILWRYLGMLLVPHQLSVMYDPPIRDIAFATGLALISWMGIAAALWYQARRWPRIVFACLTWFLLLLPVMNLFPLTTLMNDRYLYLPSIPVFGLAAWLVVRLVRWLADPHRFPAQFTVFRGALPILFAGLIIGPYLVATVSYRPVWRNGLSLWTHACSVTPKLAITRIQLANSLQQLDRTPEAIDVLRRALTECGPDAIDQRRIEHKLQEWSVDAERTTNHN
ncbi:MAG: hypothetical protein ABGZ17_29680, partial [Planctomycetaceae bacterium]